MWGKCNDSQKKCYDTIKTEHISPNNGATAADYMELYSQKDTTPALSVVEKWDTCCQ